MRYYFTWHDDQEGDDSNIKTHEDIIRTIDYYRNCGWFKNVEKLPTLSELYIFFRHSEIGDSLFTRYCDIICFKD